MVASPSDLPDPTRNMDKTLADAREAVVRAMRDNDLPESWYVGRNALLHIDMVIAAAAPVIEEGVCEWFEKEILPFIMDQLQQAAMKEGG